MLKITQMNSAAATVTLRLEGRIVGPWIAEMEKACTDLPVPGATLALNLAEVSYVERRGLELLQQLQTRGVVLLDCPNYIREELKGSSRPGDPGD